MAQRPSAQIRPNTARLGDGTTATHPPMTGPMRGTKRRWPGWGSFTAEVGGSISQLPMSACGDPSNPDSQGRSGPGRTWAAPVPGRRQGDRRRPATGLAARGRGCGPRAHAPCRGASAPGRYGCGCRPWRPTSRVVLPSCRNPTQVAGPASPQLTTKLTANPPDNRGPRQIALDGYIRPELRRCGGR
jgi:hypothetical protein